METLDWLRSPAHTGENRCWPCTIVNAALVTVFALWLLVRKRRLTGLTVATVGVSLIYLRGYVVPYTPEFAPRLVAASPLPDELFHDEQFEPRANERESLAETDRDGEAVFRELSAAGVIEPDGEMLHLSAEVETAWHEEIDRLADLPLDELATEIERTVPNVSEADSLEVEGDEWVVLGENGAYLSHPVAIAELAAYLALEPHLSDDLRLAGAHSLLMFLEACPVCDTEIVESSEANCCGAYAEPGQLPRDTLVCPDCEQRVFVFPNE